MRQTTAPVPMCHVELAKDRHKFEYYWLQYSSTRERLRQKVSIATNSDSWIARGCPSFEFQGEVRQNIKLGCPSSGCLSYPLVSCLGYLGFVSSPFRILKFTFYWRFISVFTFVGLAFTRARSSFVLVELCAQIE